MPLYSHTIRPPDSRRPSRLLERETRRSCQIRCRLLLLQYHAICMRLYSRDLCLRRRANKQTRLACICSNNEAPVPSRCLLIFHVLVFRRGDLARSERLLVCRRIEPKKSSGRPDVRHHMLLRGDIAESVRFHQRLPAPFAGELSGTCGWQWMAGNWAKKVEGRTEPTIYYGVALHGRFSSPGDDCARL